MKFKNEFAYLLVKEYSLCRIYNDIAFSQNEKQTYQYMEIRKNYERFHLPSIFISLKTMNGLSPSVRYNILH